MYFSSSSASPTGSKVSAISARLLCAQKPRHDTQHELAYAAATEGGPDGMILSFYLCYAGANHAFGVLRQSNSLIVIRVWRETLLVHVEGVFLHFRCDCQMSHKIDLLRMR